MVHVVAVQRELGIQALERLVEGQGSLRIVVLGEAKDADFFTILGWLVAAIVAMIGVYLLSKVHPELATKALTRKHLV
mgnify:CR=1 FL=1